MKLAIAGIGNNASALVQGLQFYKSESGTDLPGVSRPSLGGINVTDIEVVAAFDISTNKVGRELRQAITETPNNYPNIPGAPLAALPLVSQGITDADDLAQRDAVADTLAREKAEVLLYSLPTGFPSLARAYAEAAISAGVAFVNCTPDPVAGLPDLLEGARAKRVPLVGDDLQSHIGSSVVHGTLLALFESRQVRLHGSHQLNIGGNADFANLRQKSEGKEASKHSALRQKVRDTSMVTVVPSAAFVPYLNDRKIGLMSFEGIGWANMPIKLDVTLQVQDSSNAAGVIIDLVRIAAVARRDNEGGFPLAAATLLKSPPMVGDPRDQTIRALSALEALEDH